MTRIVAGSAGGRTLRVPATGTRPTSERVREALFSRLEHVHAIDGARVLDLYAGSGALGLEAASRGAVRVVLVESAWDAARLCRANAVALGLGDRVEISPMRVESFLARGPLAGTPPFDLVLLDPPYALDDATLAGVLESLVRGDWLVRGAVVVVERAKRAGPPPWPPGLRADDQRAYGDTVLGFATVVG